MFFTTPENFCKKIFAKNGGLVVTAVATYHRVSTVDQDPAGARAELRAAAARMGTLALEVEEKGSGARANRPGLQRILRTASKGAFDTLLIWKLDRLGRSVLDVLHNVRLLTGAGVRVVVITQGLDLRPGGDAVSQLTLTILGAVAEFERTLIVERTRLGMERVRREGTRSGRPIGRPRAGTKPEPADVRRARAEGLSWRAVATELRCTPSMARRVVGA